MDFSHRLKTAFIPSAVAVVGASDRQGSRGTFVWNGVMNSRRILEAYPVNPKYKYLGVTPCWDNLADLPTKIDLAVIATPSSEVLPIMKQCHKLGIANVLITPGDESFTADRLWREQVVQFAQEHDLRVIGPDSIGIMRPEIGLNVSYWQELPEAGHIGLLCQSGSVTSTVLDYAKRRTFGFSSIITSGNESDVSLAEIVDFLVSDPETEIIAIHIENLRHPRSFYSALRAAARIKPVIVLKAGRGPNASRLIGSRLSTPVGDDTVFDAMLQRTGALRCDRIEEFCATLEVLSIRKSAHTGRLAILANGLGFTALAADAADTCGVTLASLQNASSDALAQITGAPVPPSNPVDIGADASAERVAAALNVLLNDPQVDGVMVVLAPMAVNTIPFTAQLLAQAADSTFKPVIISWVSDRMDDSVRVQLKKTRIPCLSTPVLGVEAFKHLAQYEQGKMARQVPPQEGSEVGRWDFGAIRCLIDEAKSRAMHRLNEVQCQQLLLSIGIRLVPSYFATTAEDAALAAKRLEYPVVLKLSADGLVHKSDIGGVVLNVTSEADVRKQFEALRSRCREGAPMALFRGVSVQKMVDRTHARELSVRVITDPVLGPNIRFSLGGGMAEIYDDVAIDLIPLSEPQARALIERTRVARSLRAFRSMPPVDYDALVQTLLRISRLVCEIPTIVELHINPLLADDKGVIALDADIWLNARPSKPDTEYSHLLIAPYPSGLERTLATKAGLMKVRSVRADDFAGLKRLISRLSPQSAYLRFRKAGPEITDAELIDFTQIDYDRQAARLVIDDSYIGPEIHGIARFSYVPGDTVAEFGILIEDTYQGKGFGHLLMDSIEQEARARGLQRLVGFVLKGNDAMAALMKRRGYQPSPCRNDDNSLVYSLNL